MSARPDLADLAGVPTTAASGEAAPSPDDLLRGRLMQRSLQALLDQVQGSRAALPHLAALEVALIQHGAGIVTSISARGLTKILHQLRILPLDPADGNIQDLFALVQRTLRRQSREQHTHQLSPNDPQSTVVISETSESDFMDALADARGGRSPH